MGRVFCNLAIYRNCRRHATCQQIVAKRGNFKLLIVNLQDNTGLCHYVMCVRETSVVGSNKRELKVMKPFKYKFSSDTIADCVARHYLPELYFLRNFIGSTQLMTYFQCAIADNSVREVEYCTIVPFLSESSQ